MPQAPSKDLPVGPPPPGVPIDQTMAVIDYGSGGAGLGIVWLWRKVRGVFPVRRSQK